MDRVLIIKLAIAMVLIVSCLDDVLARQMTPEYAVSKSRPKTLLLVPSILATATENGSRGFDVALSIEETQLGELIDDAIFRKLSKSGFEVIYLSWSELSKNKEKQQLYWGVRQEYLKESDSFISDKSMLSYNWFGLGRSSSVLAGLYNVDALALSNALVTKGVLPSSVNKAEIKLDVVIVDGETANFEAAFSGASKFRNMDDDNRLSKDVKKIVNSVLLEVKNARKRKPVLLEDVEVKKKQKFMPVAQEAALVESLEILVPNLYEPFDFVSDSSEDKLIEELEQELRKISDKVLVEQNELEL